ncbi:MAG TPA: PD-(D/E)XK nuclease family protein [Stellaceae bacterium]|nr:PD-(D/E)XK nuclease family protein [Stellaceae bacterium]
MGQARSAERKPALSPTKIATFLQCAVKYRYIYIDKIGRYYLRARAGFSFGSTLHGVLQGFHAGGERQTAEEMAEELERKWIAAGYESPREEAEYRAAGAEIVTAYRAAQEGRAERGVAAIATERTISLDLARFKLTGRVDRIDRHADGSVEVVDYKSGRLDVTPEEVRASLAMCCYQLILARQYPGSAVSGTIYCLRSGRSATASLSREELDEFERDIVAIGSRILDMDFQGVAPVPVPACEACDFLSRCRQYWRSAPPGDGWIEASPHSDEGL